MSRPVTNNSPHAAYERQRYHDRVAQGLCGACGRVNDRAPLSTCQICRDKQANRQKPVDELIKGPGRARSIDHHESDEVRFMGRQGTPDEAKGCHTHARERQCATAFRVERYSIPMGSWEVVIYAKPLHRAATHAQTIAQSYRDAGITHYSRVRVVDCDGRLVAEEKI